MNEYNTLFNSIPDSLLRVRLIDGLFRFVDANEAVLRATGLTAEQLLNKSPEQILPAEQAQVLSSSYQRCMQTGEEQRVEMPFDGPWGRRTWQVRIALMQGAPAELICVARDITGSREWSHQLDIVADYLPGFVYQLTYNPADGQWKYTYVGRRVEAMFGVSAAEVMTDANVLLDMIHPDDLPQVMASSFATADSLQPWHQQFRMVLNDERIVWLQCHDLPQRTVDGTVIWTGYAEDITLFKTMEQSLQRSESRYRSLVENANDIIATVERNGTLSYVSSNWTTTLGHSVPEVMGTHVSDYIHPDDLPICMAVLQKLFATGEPQSGIEYRVRHKDGHWVWQLTNGAPLLNAQGQLESVMIIARDVTLNRAVQSEIRQLAETDALTGLPNRKTITTHIQLMIEVARLARRRFAVFFLDLDKFKPVNDQYGHAVGDALLIDVGRRIKHVLRATDLVGRLGGDEFVVILNEPGSADQVLEVADKLLGELNKPFQIGSVQANISASIGIAFYPDQGGNADELLHAADAAMYQAKSAGRNRAVLAPSPGPLQVSQQALRPQQATGTVGASARSARATER